MYGSLVKWLTHCPLKAAFTGSNPVRVTIVCINAYLWAFFYVIEIYALFMP